MIACGCIVAQTGRYKPSPAQFPNHRLATLPAICNSRLAFMHKTSSALLGALVLAVTGIVVWKAGPRSPAGVVVPAMAKTAGAVQPVSPASSETGSNVNILDDPSFDGVKGMKPGYALLDGRKPPDLPADAPRRVRFGVVLVQYRGAQRAPLASRSKAEALELANSLVGLARKDFAAAVAKGDEGSTDQAGWMPAGVLEPAPEYVLLTTEPGDVGGPVDTPTGYWIVKNISKAKP